MDVNDTVWQEKELTQKYLEGVRGAIPMAQEQIDMMMRLIGWSQESVVSFLDLGCGDGVLGQVILDVYSESAGVFVDFSEPMLAAAEGRLAAYEERVTLIQGDYGQPGWFTALQPVAGWFQTHNPDRNGSKFQSLYNVIVSGFSIHHQPDRRKQALYQELYQLLTPGGIFINIEHVASHSRWGEMLFEEAFVDSMVTYHKMNNSSQSRLQIANDFFNRPDKDANILTPVETQCSWLRDTGFIHVDCYFKFFELAVFAGIKPN